MEKTIMDVSRHQGVIDWAKVKASGRVNGVMIRAMGNSAEGRPSAPYTDPQFARNYAECKRLGIPCGVYGYFKAVDREQAGKELAYFKKLLTGRSFELPVAVDIEDEVQKPLGKAALTDLTAHILSTVERWGVYAMLYTGLWFGSTFLYMGGAELKPYDVWLAAYRTRKPAPGWPFGMWQYTSTARMPGVSTNVDMSQLKRRIERQEARQEAAEKAREEFETNLYESSLAAIALGEATAKAVQRIPDAHCNGDMHAALNYAAEVKHKQRDFVAKRGISAIIN